MSETFELVGIRQAPEETALHRAKWWKGRPVLAAAALLFLLIGCFGCELFLDKDPGYCDLGNCNVPPGKEFLFGTDPMGRDIFSMVWAGGRVSLAVGFTAAFVSGVIAFVFGAVSGCAPSWVDGLLMRLAEILLSVPGLLAVLLAVLLVQGLFGGADWLRISIAVGLTSWMGIAKMVRTQVRQLRDSEYVVASKCMGGGFFHILRNHLAPHFVPSVLFMAVMNIRNAIMMESTLSFMGIGLSVEAVSWGNMLSVADKALLTKSWWIIVAPGMFLAVTLLCVTRLGDCLRTGGDIHS